ncbi:MAG: hypothetical protein NT178_07020 [Proteobacteria bacterium]|nr:hypothetical protein [Pseudomonadota bacterium]
MDDVKDFIRSVSPEIPKRQRQPARPELTTVIPQPNKATDEQLLLARRHNYTLQEIADHLSIHYATVSRKVKRYRDRERKD